LVSIGGCDLGAPALGSALEDVAVMQQSIQHGSDGGDIGQELAPVSTGRFDVSRVLARS